MYQFSRSIYRDLVPRIEACRGAERTLAARRVLEACEATMQRLVSDRRYFARPAKTLFSEVREHFALAEQVRVYMVIERHIERLEVFLDSLPGDVTLDGQQGHPVPARAAAGEGLLPVAQAPRGNARGGRGRGSRSLGFWGTGERARLGVGRSAPSGHQASVLGSGGATRRD